MSYDEADAEHVGHGNMYTSRLRMPADLALLSEPQAAVSMVPVECHARAITVVYPLECKHWALDRLNAELKSTPFPELLTALWIS